MAIDQAQLLQILLRGEGGGPQPTSGLQDPSLSGLMLGPQGMGFGGGESLMGGGTSGIGFGGGEGLGGLDIDQLLAQLQAARGVTGARLTSGIGAGSPSGFGAGGTLGVGPGLAQAPPTAGQSGQAGLGASNTTAQLLGLLREGTGLGKSLLELFPKGPTATDLQGLNLPELTAFSPSAGEGLSSLEQLSAANPGLFSLTGNVSPIPALDPSKFAGVFGSPPLFNTTGIEALGPGGAPELAGELGPGGAGVAEQGGTAASQVTPGLLDSFGQGFGQVAFPLAVASFLANTGQRLASGDVRGGLLNLFTGGLGGTLSDLFGGGGPSHDWLTFPSRLAGTLGGEQSALSALDQAIQQAQSPQALQQAVGAFQQAIQGAGVGDYLSRPQTEFGPVGFQWAPIPGAGGSRHEGGQVAEFGPIESQLGSNIAAKLSQFQSMPKTQPPLGQPIIPQPTQAAPVVGLSGVQGMTLPGSGDPNLLTLLQRMGLV